MTLFSNIENKLFLALDSNTSELEKYKLKDFSHKTRYKEVSSMISVKNDNSLKKALNLIQLLMSKNGVEPKKKYIEVYVF